MGARQNPIAISIDRMRLVADPTEILLSDDPFLRKIVCAVGKDTLVDYEVLSLPELGSLVSMDVIL